jgi:hypothetical protein
MTPAQQNDNRWFRKQPHAYGPGHLNYNVKHMDAM